MPTYVYVCPEGHQVELRRPIAKRDEEAACPECGAVMVRKLYTEVGMHFPARWIPTKQGWQRGDM